MIVVPLSVLPKHDSRGQAVKVVGVRLVCHLSCCSYGICLVLCSMEIQARG